MKNDLIPRRIPRRIDIAIMARFLQLLHDADAPGKQEMLEILEMFPGNRSKEARRHALRIV